MLLDISKRPPALQERRREERRGIFRNGEEGAQCPGRVILPDCLLPHLHVKRIKPPPRFAGWPCVPLPINIAL